MRTLLSYRELDDLGTALISDYRKRTGRRGADSVDIEGFMRDYLGLRRGGSSHPQTTAGGDSPWLTRPPITYS